MSESLATIEQLQTAAKLARLNMHENGAHSHSRGIGLLLRTLENQNPQTRDQLIEHLGWSREQLKNVVKKAQKHNLVDLINDEEQHSYQVQLTATGAEVLKRRTDANIEAADKLLAGLTEEEVAQLNAITAKIIATASDNGAISLEGKGHRIHRCRHYRH